MAYARSLLDNSIEVDMEATDDCVWVNIGDGGKLMIQRSSLIKNGIFVEAFRNDKNGKLHSTVGSLFFRAERIDE